MAVRLVRLLGLAVVCGCISVAPLASAGVRTAHGVCGGCKITVRAIGASMSKSHPSVVRIVIKNVGSASVPALWVAFQPAALIVSASPKGRIDQRPSNSNGPGYLWRLEDIASGATRTLRLRVQSASDARVGRNMGAYLLQTWAGCHTNPHDQSGCTTWGGNLDSFKRVILTVTP